jgi:hypothetical protein
MKGKRKWLLCPLIIVALLLCAIPAYADTPTLPHAFYGTLTIIGGSPAPVGTVVTAKVGGVQCGSITTTVEGQYGGSGAFDPKLTVTGEIETGATIYFYASGSQANETYAFSPGAVTELNLTVPPPSDITPPTVTIVALSPDPTRDNTPTFTGTATDDQSNISSVEYRVDSGSWALATASDGAFDEISEEYTFTTSTLTDGAHTVYVRATDAASNTTTEDDYDSDSFTVDTTAPTVVSVSPEDEATGVAVDTVVTATFSEAMDDSTITTSSFTLDSVAGSVSYDSGTYTATFTPSADLTADTTYTATLSTVITDVAGNSLAAEYSWSFSTPPYTPGDATGDGVVDARDITKVERIIATLDAETAGADANQDGVVNALDITKVERIIVGLD